MAVEPAAGGQGVSFSPRRLFGQRKPMQRQQWSQHGRREGGGGKAERGQRDLLPGA